jgi:hypothetical protein
MDGIVLARLVDEMTLKIEREKARERAEAVRGSHPILPCGTVVVHDIDRSQ